MFLLVVMVLRQHISIQYFKYVLREMLLVFWNLAILLLPVLCLSSGSSKGAEEVLKFFFSDNTDGWLLFQIF